MGQVLYLNSAISPRSDKYYRGAIAGVRFRIPLFWKPSVLALEVEEALLSRLPCPACGRRPLDAVSRSELEGGGHLVKLSCPSCNRTMDVKFVFTGPRLDENPDESFDLAFRHLLEACEGQEFINRLKAIHREMEEHGWGHYVERRLRDDLVRYRLQGKSDPKAMAKARKISKYLEVSS